MEDKLLCITICIVVTVITNRILAIHTFNVIDDYMTDTCNEIIKITRETIQNVYLRR